MWFLLWLFLKKYIAYWRQIKALVLKFCRFNSSRPFRKQYIRFSTLSNAINAQVSSILPNPITCTEKKRVLSLLSLFKRTSGIAHNTIYYFFWACGVGLMNHGSHGLLKFLPLIRTGRGTSHMKISDMCINIYIYIICLHWSLKLIIL